METDIRPYRKTESVFNHLPKGLLVYVLLARWDRPTGIALLFFPCCWGFALAGAGVDYWHLYLQFFLGAVAMRGAGCTYNDIIDVDFDAQVERTKRRPLPAGDITYTRAILFLCAQLFVGAVVLYQFNTVTQAVAAVSLVFVALYPFMKRWTYWPQAFLGLTFNWGVFVAYAAVHGSVSLLCLLLYFVAISWTIVYDTIYACQDKDDDVLVGVKSTALRFGPYMKSYLYFFMIIMCLGLVLLGYVTSAHFMYYVLVGGAMVYLIAGVYIIDIGSRAACLRFFKRNIMVGLLIFLAIYVGGGQ